MSQPRLALVLLALTLGCGKPADRGPQAGILGGPCLPSGGCDQGLACLEKKCAVAPAPAPTPAQQQAVSEAMTTAHAAEQALLRAEAVPESARKLDNLKAIGDVWTAVEALVPEAKKVGEWLPALDAAITVVKELRGGVESAERSLQAIDKTLAQLASGPLAGKPLAEIQKVVSGEVRAVVEPLDRLLVAAIEKGLRPARETVDKASALVVAVCALPLGKSIEEKRAPACAEATLALATARDLLAEAERLVLTLRGDVAARLAALRPYLDDETWKILETVPVVAPAPAPAP